MASGQDVVEEYVTLFENNLTDYNSVRSADNKKWIYDDLPRLDVSQYPRIGVTIADESDEPHEIGSFNIRRTINVQVVLYVKKAQKFTISSVSKRDVQVMALLSEQILTLFKSQSTHDDLLNNADVYHAFIENISDIPDDHVLIKQMIFKNIMVR